MRQEAAKFVSKLENNAQTYDDVKKKTDFIINHAINNPKEFAYQKQTGPYAYMLTAANAVPYLGSRFEQGLEDVKEKIEGQDTINRRATTNGFAQDLGINYTADKFGNLAKSVGPQLVKAGQEAKNIGIDKPAYTNLMNAYIIKSNAQQHADWSESWNDYRTSHIKADPYDWMHSDDYKRIQRKYDDALKEKMDSLSKGMPKNGDADVDSNGNQIFFWNGQYVRVKK